MTKIPDDNTLVRDVTIGQLRVALFGKKRSTTDNPTNAPVPEPKLYLFGIKGIEDFFHVSHKTAQEYKNTFLQPAVNQNGRIIVTDAELALQLFKENEAQKHAK